MSTSERCLTQKLLFKTITHLFDTECVKGYASQGTYIIMTKVIYIHLP